MKDRAQIEPSGSTNFNISVKKFKWLEELNPQQLAAVTYGDGPLIVVAGAGSGKTRTLAYRVAYLIEKGVRPYRTLLLTFTRRAASEMLKRAESIVTRASTMERVWGGTFHSIGYRLLRMYGRNIGLNPDFTVMDRTDTEDMIGVLRQEMGLSSKEQRFPQKTTCADIYSRYINSCLPLEQVLAESTPWCSQWLEELEKLFKLYNERKQKLNILDYDDLLLYWKKMLTDNSLAQRLENMFDHILVDEYQDTNIIQAEILIGMRQRNRNIMVVGDDAQSIYSFRGATVRNMLDFPKHFPEAKVIALEQNYRSTMPILNVTNCIIEQASERYTKTMWSTRTDGPRPKLVTCEDESKQDEFIVKMVLKHYEENIPLKNQAVLFRTASLSDSLEVELSRRNIPYRKYGGLRFTETAHIKDMLAFLKLLENPRDELAWFRVLQLLKGVGPATSRKVTAHVIANNGRLDSLNTFKLPPSSAPALKELFALLIELQKEKESNIALQLQKIRKFYQPIMFDNYDSPQSREQDIDNLERIATGYSSRKDFLTDLLLEPPTSSSDLAERATKDNDWLVLSTIHSAKGCEWDVVYLIHASDGCLPSDLSVNTPEQLEEELRLAYVAMTRARDYLYITWPVRYYHRHSPYAQTYNQAHLSRFLNENVLELLDTIFFGGIEEQLSYYHKYE